MSLKIASTSSLGLHTFDDGVYNNHVNFNLSQCQDYGGTKDVHMDSEMDFHLEKTCGCRCHFLVG